MTYSESLSAIGAAADAEVAALKARIAVLESQVITPPPPPVDPPPVEPPPAPSGTRLRWAPPVLTNPTVIDLSSQSLPSSLDTTRDYEIRLPETRAYNGHGTGLTIQGGRNVVIVGGEVLVAPSGGVCRAAYFKSNAGTVHLEGVRFRSTTGVFTEGIDNASASSVLQIENVWVDGLCSGSVSTNHADILQTWNGPKTLRVDGLKGRTNYQAAFLNARDTNSSAQPAEGTWEMHRCDFESVSGKYTLWLVTPPSRVTTSQVHCWGQSNGEWKPEMWPGILHTKPTEDFTGGAGLGYVSPGYLG